MIHITNEKEQHRKNSTEAHAVAATETSKQMRINKDRKHV